MAHSNTKIPTIQDVKTIVDRISPIPARLWDEFAKTVRIDQVSKGTILQSGEEPVTQGWLVAKGLVRSYSLTADGDEVTMGFFPEGSICCAYASYLRKKNSQDILQAIEDSVCVAVDLSMMNELVAEHIEWNTFLRKVTEHYLVNLYERSTNLLRMNAAERLANFRETRGDVASRLSQRHLASYLGISREALNRLLRDG